VGEMRLMAIFIPDEVVEGDRISPGAGVKKSWLNVYKPFDCCKID